jgi:hypothetical protein
VQGLALSGGRPQAVTRVGGRRISSVVDHKQAKAELESVVASGIFAKAPSLAQLLGYVCTKYFAGRTEQIKEYNVAVEALGRPASFDPRKDSIVRVEAFRLRKRLKQYYENEGSEHALRIVIPPGQYVPQFLEKGPAAEVQESPESILDENAELLALPAAGDSEVAPLQAPAQPRPTGWTWRAASIGLPLAIVAIAAAGFLFWRWPARSSNASGATAAPMVSEADEIRILAGSPASRYVDRLGNNWSGDRFFQGGSVFATPNHVISGTPDPELFRSRREGDFSYDVPLRPGVYELHLYFAETLFGENNTAGGGESSRVFRISINGAPKLWAFDVLSDADGSNTADEKVFKDISPASDGKLHVQFAGLVNNVPFLNALEIVPGIPGKIRPVRIAVLSHGYTDQHGRVWGADRYFSHGCSVVRSEPVRNTLDPDLFKAERFGNFTYTVPVAEGRYNVTLQFAESWFGPGQPGGGGPGSRAFDVYCNGVALLHNFDLFRAAGGDHRAVERTFNGVAPNAQGKIVLSFVPITNYACVNAIEVADEKE